MLILPTTPLLALFEGFALIVSPCILSVLPLFLASSLVGNRRQPFLIIAGFILGFTVFALLSPQFLTVFHIQYATFQYISYGLLFCFGLVLSIPYLDNRFTAYTSNIASGLFLGILIGIIWTPCAGPLLSAALTQIAQSTTSLMTVMTIIASGIGAGIPLLIIALFCQQLIRKIKFISRYSHYTRRSMGLIIVIVTFMGFA